MKSHLEELIARIDKNSRVLDLGCGDGGLLQRLVKEKNIKPLGLEFDIERIKECVVNKIPVLQMDIDKGLTQFADNQFDFAILHQTIQEVKDPLLVFKEMSRVARKSFIIFSNFAYWKLRFRILLEGKIPMTNKQYNWYNTPNIHLMSLKDIISLCQQLNIEILDKRFLGEFPLDGILQKLGFGNFSASMVMIQIGKTRPSS